MAKLAALGSAVKRGATTIPGCRNIQGPGMEADMIDVSTHDSPSSTREKTPGLIDPGVCTFELLWDPADANHQQIRTDFMARTSTTWHVVAMGGGAADDEAFTAFVSKFGPVQLAVDGAQVRQIELAVTGPVTVS